MLLALVSESFEKCRNCNKIRYNFNSQTYISVLKNSKNVYYYLKESNIANNKKTTCNSCI